MFLNYIIQYVSVQLILLKTSLLQDNVERGWTPVGDLVVARTNIACVEMSDGRVMVAGGATGESDGTLLDSVEIFDPGNRR